MTTAVLFSQDICTGGFGRLTQFASDGSIVFKGTVQVIENKGDSLYLVESDKVKRSSRLPLMRFTVSPQDIQEGTFDFSYEGSMV